VTRGDASASLRVNASHYARPAQGGRQASAGDVPARDRARGEGASSPFTRRRNVQRLSVRTGLRISAALDRQRPNSGLLRASDVGRVESGWVSRTLVCGVCARPLPVQTHAGNPRRWCSERCRLAAWRRRKRQAQNKETTK
jgi:hypothetical protein